MPIKRGRLIHLLSNHPNLTDKAFRHKEVADSLKFTLNDTKSKIEKEQVEDSIEFTLWNDLWNEYGTFGKNKDKMVKKSAQDRYSRGQKVFINFGYNVGREASMPHPAIILKNFKHLAIVLPTTTNDGVHLGDLEDLVVKCSPDGDVFPGSDLVELHQIRCIGKNRIISDLGKNVKDYKLNNGEVDRLNGIMNKRIATLGIKLTEPIIPYSTDLRTILDLLINFHYSPDTFELTLKMQQEIDILTEENQKLKASKEAKVILSQAAISKDLKNND